MSIDFSRNAKVYDQRHGNEISRGLVDELVKVAGLSPKHPILDLASGTGRVALGLARAGLNVTATDISANMLDQLKIKAGTLPIKTQTLSVGALPYTDKSWAAISLARILYLIPDWPDYLDEISRILSSDGVLLHEWGNGDPSSPWVKYREALREKLCANGFKDIFHPGARREDEIHAYLDDLGWNNVASVSSGPGTRMTLGDFIHMVETHEASYLWNVPEDVQTRILPALRHWAEERLGSLDQTIEMPGHAHWQIYRRK